MNSSVPQDPTREKRADVSFVDLMLMNEDTENVKYLVDDEDIKSEDEDDDAREEGEKRDLNFSSFDPPCAAKPFTPIPVANLSLASLLVNAAPLESPEEEPAKKRKRAEEGQEKKKRQRRRFGSIPSKVVAKALLKYQEHFDSYIPIVSELHFLDRVRNKTLLCLGILFTYIMMVIRHIQENCVGCRNMLFDGPQFIDAMTNAIVSIGPDCPLVGDPAMTEVWKKLIYGQALNKAKPYGLNPYLTAILSNNASEISSLKKYPLSTKTVRSAERITQKSLSDAIHSAFSTPSSYGVTNNAIMEFLYIYDTAAVVKGIPPEGLAFSPLTLENGMSLCIREAPTSRLNFALGLKPVMIRQAEGSTNLCVAPTQLAFTPADLNKDNLDRLTSAAIATLDTEECRKLFREKLVHVENTTDDCVTTYKPDELQFATKYLHVIKALQSVTESNEQ